ncbi:MAG: hypothetical protein Q7R57_03015, partial [Dehalococcoidales bacterium]|nr:hypothetical protein [Dehalococcoidales bacterium]
YKAITDAKPFPTYQEAVNYAQAQKNRRIIGANPFSSPVPLEALKDFKLVYGSPNTVTPPEVNPTSEVKIFQYTGPRK